VKYLIILAVALSLSAEDIKSLPNQAGNGNIDLAGTAIVDAKEIQQVLGAPLDSGYVVVKLKASPRTADAIRISPDDFTLISHKDGERSAALDPGQIAGGGANLVLSSKRHYDGSPGVSNTTVSVSPGKGSKEPDKALMELLKAKMLPDQETKEPVEGLLYFLMEGKNKPKDLGLLYKGPAGRLSVDFK
jgi:hypothetical protein